jgi:hypothetical protein
LREAYEVFMKRKICRSHEIMTTILLIIPGLFPVMKCKNRRVLCIRNY